MSNFNSFNIVIDNNDGTVTPVPNQTVKVYDVTNATPLADTASDEFGVVPGASVAVAAGTRLRFSVTRVDGLNGCAEQETI
ncbi:MAG: hypothetical protein LC803_16600 [Acidobacteria bacterium]|nr:hypothetical protein [Acidobacteriota bacterium]